MIAAKDQQLSVRRVVSVAVSPCPVDAGAELTITVRVTADANADLAAQCIIIYDNDGAQLATATFAAADDEGSDKVAYVASALISAPRIPGEQVWSAILPAAAYANGLRHGEVKTAFTFIVVAHAAEINVWDLPPAISAGERFALKIGIKCPCNCNLGGRPFSIFDAHGDEVGVGSLGGAVWPGTSALYFADVDMAAPAAPGYYEWSVRTPRFETAERPHAVGKSRFGVRAMPAPEVEVTITAIDSEKQTPITGIHVLLHPYRTYTDEHGIARMRVARGHYQLVVSGLRYVPYETTIDATGDVTARAELVQEQRGDGYFQP